jgi:hypothetical protein
MPQLVLLFNVESERGGKEAGKKSNASPSLPQTLKHGTDAIEPSRKFFAILFRDISFVLAHFKPQPSFVTRTDCDLQISFEFGRRGALCPTLYYVRRNRSSGATHLSRQFKLFKTGKALNQFRNSKCRRV